MESHLKISIWQIWTFFLNVAIQGFFWFPLKFMSSLFLIIVVHFFFSISLSVCTHNKSGIVSLINVWNLEAKNSNFYGWRLLTVCTKFTYSGDTDTVWISETKIDFMMLPNASQNEREKKKKHYFLYTRVVKPCA